MKERVAKIRADISEFWSSRSKAQKITYIGSTLGIILIAALLTFFLTRTEYVPLYTDVSQSEVGRIKEHLDSIGVPNEIAPGGTSISVPKEQVDDLLVALAAEGFPKSGTIDYSFYAENAGFGTTDNEFNMLKNATLQTELANLLKGIEGVQDANVMLTLPTPSVFVSEVSEGASASIILKTAPSHEFTEEQMTALYNLVSKSLPSLDIDDIVIMNQYSEVFDLTDPTRQYGASVADQMTIKKSIEKDIQRQVQQMLGTMMGQDKVVVSVTTDIDFKAENRVEDLKEPVDEENMEGIALSVQRITESFTGDDPGAEGQVEAGDPTDNRTSYLEGNFGGMGDYERVEETINNEVNRIRKEIVESPYKIRDLGIQVVIDPPVDEEGEVEELPAELQEDVEQILTTVIRTSINEEVGELTDEELSDKIAVMIQPFNGSVASFDDVQTKIPTWIFVVGGLLIAAIIGTIIFFVRKRKKEEEEALIAAEEAALAEQEAAVEQVEDINDGPESESVARRKQLEKMAKDKPEEFAKLLRTWISED